MQEVLRVVISFHGTSEACSSVHPIVGGRFFNDATSWSSIEQQAGVVLSCPSLPRGHADPPPAVPVCTRFWSRFLVFFAWSRARALLGFHASSLRRPPVLHALWTRCGRVGVLSPDFVVVFWRRAQDLQIWSSILSSGCATSTATAQQLWDFWLRRVSTRHAFLSTLQVSSCCRANSTVCKGSPKTDDRIRSPSQ